jgi:hypothetical protein
MADIERKWVDSLDSVEWPEPTRWRPVIVIVSYLFASATVNAAHLVGEVMRLLERLGRGPVTVLYTNSPRPYPNRNLPAFQKGLEEAGFVLIADDLGKIQIERSAGQRVREFRYALFQRQAQTTLPLEDG